MDTNISFAIKSSAMILALGLCFVRYRQMNYKKKQLELITKQDPQGFQVLKTLKTDESKLIKAKLKKDEISINCNQKRTTDIHYNQFYLQQPSDVLIVQQLYKDRFNLCFSKANLNFVDAKGKQVQIRGIQQIIGDVYSFKHSYERYECGMLKRLWGGFCFYIQNFFDLFRKAKFQQPTLQQIPPSRKPFILGPVIGVLHYSVGLLTDSFFVLKVKFQNGFHKFQVLAESKNALLGQYELQIAGLKFESFIFGIFSVVFGVMFYKDVKKWLKMQNIQRIFAKGKNKVLQVQNVDQEKACIICFTNCRNLILFDCKHLIMCWDCFKTVKQDNCPICKKHIEVAKIIQTNKNNDKKVLKPLSLNVNSQSQDNESN